LLIKGTNLSRRQREQVLRAFRARWTDQSCAVNYGGDCPACVQAEYNGDDSPHDAHPALLSEIQWLGRHSFHFSDDGQTLRGDRLAIERR
jgi:hypothetical protein